MHSVSHVWNDLEDKCINIQLSDDQIQKIDALVFSDDIANIRNGLTLMCTLDSHHLCRYVEMVGSVVALRESSRFAAPLLAERALVEAVRDEELWTEIVEKGVFDPMGFRALGFVPIEQLSLIEKYFCVRMSEVMVRVPSGEFMMGDPSMMPDDITAEYWEGPSHKVTLTKDCMVGRYAVTQVLWESVMGFNPSHFKGANRPVEQVSWYDCIEFCNKLSEKNGLDPVYIIDGKAVTCNWNVNGYRLLTEAEWEYAARASQNHLYAGSDKAKEVAWYHRNSKVEYTRQTHPVGQKKSNGFGLYDMSGNVDEWVWDVAEVDNAWNLIGDSLYTNAAVIDPYGSMKGDVRMLRGGCWNSPREHLIPWTRNIEQPMSRRNVHGFRIACFTMNR